MNLRHHKVGAASKKSVSLTGCAVANDTARKHVPPKEETGTTHKKAAEGWCSPERGMHVGWKTGERCALLFPLTTPVDGEWPSGCAALQSCHPGTGWHGQKADGA